MKRLMLFIVVLMLDGILFAHDGRAQDDGRPAMPGTGG